MSCSRSGDRKCEKSDDSDNTDRLSDLPEGLISHILSCLPTKNAVQTCVLSRAWERNWTSAYNIKIDDRGILEQDERREESDKARCISFIYRVLLLSTFIRSFEFFTDKTCDVSHFTKWISDLLKHKLEIFKLCAPVSSNDPDQIILSENLLNCISLKELELEVCCTFKVPHKICFPNLTKLYLEYVHILNDDSSIDTLVFCFPVLETFELKSCRWSKVRFVEIQAPLLRNIMYAKLEQEIDDCVIKVLGAKLTEFLIWGHMPEKFLLTGSTVHSAILDMTDITANAGLGARRLMHEFSNLREFKLSCQAAQAIAETISGASIPMYGKLGKLRLSGFVETGYKYSANVLALFMLLHAAPVLEYLIIDIAIPGTDSQDEETYEQVEDGFNYELVEAIFVPSCLSRIKKIKFKGLDNNPHQFNLVRFLLKNCPELKEFRVNHNKSAMSLDLLCAKLPSFPRAATKRVEFTIYRKI